MASKAKTGLTEKQEAFAVAFVQTANAAEAYRRAYDVEESSKDSWIYVEALQLLEHPKIAPRIKELQERAKSRGQFTVNKAAEELEEARQLAHREGQAGAAVSAVQAKIKLFGMDHPTKLQAELTGKDRGPIKTETTDVSATDALRAFLAKSSAAASEPSSE